MFRADASALQQRGLAAPPHPVGQRARFGKRRRRRPPREETTLVCLIKSQVERKVVVELRNDILLRGRLDDVDDFLNMSLSEVIFQTVEGHKVEYESIYVKGRNVRFVHLPRSLDPAKAIEAYRRKVVRTKLEAAQERARAMGSAKREPKGQDAMDVSGGVLAGEGLTPSEEGAGEDEESDGDGGEMAGEEGGEEAGSGDTEEEEEWGAQATVRGPGRGEEASREGERRGVEAAGGLRHLDPRAAAAGSRGGGAGDEGAEEAGLGVFGEEVQR
ncbi:hypothetical protein PLESTB_001141000 [Pleodorina starrii]|uniref:Sm domain-containing protein n=1 Tax=Pleodorina starrii TaxID=330485 RepID=A0A9W6F505_9CHLO|nr:hypothetical protein PLESTM_000563600 [Pleodorina starrii]GLC56743.1 hypothetical protein PLESTB_001141000 [Pleodorina starrii]GLC66899.1 hypothetical protein PLESTF_000488300 [Pleodorina starrii]